VLEISVLMAQFPSFRIARSSYEYRTLGLGYANLGALLMRNGIPYDSDEGRAICGALSAIMTGDQLRRAPEMAKELGPFPEVQGRTASLCSASSATTAAPPSAPSAEYEGLSIRPVGIDAAVARATSSPPRARRGTRPALGEKHGYRNAQHSVIAPTGTIGLVMDCDTTGVEPDFALVKFKKLAGGGYFKIINESVPPALRKLGYTQAQIDAIITYATGAGTLLGAPASTTRPCAPRLRRRHPAQGRGRAQGGVRPQASRSTSTCSAASSARPPSASPTRSSPTRC
jgi:ribonucleoside-diphosphate reductase alpha chain